MVLSLLWSLSFLACNTENKQETGNVVPDSDADGDGMTAEGGDCNDTNETVFMGAPELCDGIDNNCDGEIDEDTEKLWYVDTDGDGFGSNISSVSACEPPAGYVESNTDCDDENRLIYPGAPELCTDLIDLNCDGLPGGIDEDGDGFATCEDCNESDPTINAGAMEVCDPDNVDEDCDGLADDADDSVDPSTQTIVWTDSDGDGFGEDATIRYSCEGGASAGGDCNDADTDFYPGAPETDCDDPNDYNCDGYVGAVDNDGDGFYACEECDDGEVTTYPGATEVCDSVDNNCNGSVDEGLLVPWYADADQDGYGDPSSEVESCSAVAGYVTDNTDCNDADTTIHPAALEVCDGVDQDCNGLVDDNAIDALTWYQDSDLDGYGDPLTPVLACTLSAGISASSDDCDDASFAINPAATEVCDGVDNDCDGTIDTGANVGTLWYADTDGDGYGDSNSPQQSCTQPAGYVAADGDCVDTDPAYYPGAPETDCTDPNDYNCDGSAGTTDADGDGFLACEECDDSEAAVNPTATEVCDGLDNDCDSQTDEAGAVGEQTWYYDQDGDVYGDATNSYTACNQPAGYVSDDTDCNDANNTIYPGAPEHCDGVDESCDGVIDENAVDAPTWYLDGDADGYGDASQTQVSCVQPSGYLADNTDCNDMDTAINPGALEYCDGLDNDCNGSVDDSPVDPVAWYGDSDGDGYGDGASVLACGPIVGSVTEMGDCDDSDAAYYPGAPELCNDVNDYNCDGSVGAADDDGDGFMACEECDDGDILVYPGATEICNGYDDNCDGAIDEAGAIGELEWYEDADADGYGGSNSILACEVPPGYTTNSDDCDDTRGGVYPGATEYCNGYDDDCDGQTDEAGSVGETVWYEDLDGDGYGSDVTVSACSAPPGYISTGGDCNDAEVTINPAAEDICDVIDNDCDGSLDEGGYCPCPVFTYGGHPYQICTTNTNWNDAAVQCQDSPNYVLAAPTTEDENIWLVDTALSFAAARWWVGGYDLVIEQRWEWLTGETWSYSNFAAGEGSSNSQDCLQLGNTDYTWNDASCTSSGNFICEGIP